MTVEELKGCVWLAEHGPRLGSHRAVIAKHSPTSGNLSNLHGELSRLPADG
jgi:hypothetical protein